MFTCPRQTLGKVLTNSQPACLCSLSPGSGWVINDHHVGDVDGNDVVVEGEDGAGVVDGNQCFLFDVIDVDGDNKDVIDVVKTLKSASLTGGQGLITRESGRLTVWWIE